ncbi:MAG: acylneuraminate cytidylyltransferase family protein [Candidatus Berkiella sp.]
MSELRQNLTAFIFARGGSKGIPNKNIQLLNGIPLIGYAIRAALESQYISKVIVSTDCEKIAAIARDFGAETPFLRPDALATDLSPELLAWRHAIEMEKDFFQNKDVPFISLPATSPLRNSEDIDAALNKYFAHQDTTDLVLAITESRRNPYLNMVTVRDDDFLSIVIEGAQGIRRQDVPQTYDISTSVYVANPAYLLQCKKIIEGRVRYILVPPERSIDIDDEYDFYLAELLLKHPFKQGRFELEVSHEK